MNYPEVNLDDIPEEMSKEQFRKICHISKKTALYLLSSGKVPCRKANRKTHTYTIKKKDVIVYLYNRACTPGLFIPSCGKDKPVTNHIPLEISMYEFYADLLTDYADVMYSSEICSLTGYSPHTVCSWIHKGYLKAFINSGKWNIPKTYLIEFFDSAYFRNIHRKTEWHITKLMEFKNNL